MPPKRSNPQIDFVDYLQIDLDEVAITHIQELEQKPAQLWDAIETMVEDKYRIVFAVDVVNGTYKLSAMDISPDRTSKGYMVSAEAPTLCAAMAVLVYKHIGVCSSDWVPFCGKSRKAKGYR